MNNRYEGTRYEVIAWDGCGSWEHGSCFDRQEARNAKKYLRRIIIPNAPEHALRTGILDTPKWPAIKIWDRKRKMFIT